MRLVLLVLLILPALALAQTEEVEDAWAPLRPIIGQWEGTGSGPAGRSRIEASYEFVLGDNYIEAWHRSMFEPSERNPDGETHEDRGFISYDGNRETFVFRQFHVEGFINRYTLDSLSTDGKTLYFNSEDIENAPPGTRAKLEFHVVSDTELTTSFHVAWPGTDFQCFSTNSLMRK